MLTLKDINWENTVLSNNKLYDLFYEEYKKIPFLVKHREHIKKYTLGYGEDPFHFMWYLLISSFDIKKISFLEIGVFKGQILSLVPLICKHLNIECDFLGASPLDGAGDRFCEYGKIDHLPIIKDVFKFSGIPFTEANVLRGLSTAENIKNILRTKKFDLIYIDGSHNYEDVVSDINLCSGIVNKNGFIVLDDASFFLNVQKENPPLYDDNPPRGRCRFNGFEDVGRALQDTIEKNDKFIHVLACGHNRVFKYIGE